jgi:photosystem II stability/assembly factor-like uncharacterized protein
MVLALAAGLFVTGLVIGSTQLSATRTYSRARAQAPAAPTQEVQGYALVSPEEGWLLVDQWLYWTGDAGQSWQDITPEGIENEEIAAGTFVDNRLGWLALTRSNPGESDSFRMSRTQDGGQSWQFVELDLFEPNDPDGLAGAVSLFFLDEQTGWMVVKAATSSNFSRGTLFKTGDGGSTWQELSIPIGEPVTFVDEMNGWTAGGASGEEYYQTSDGGLTWQAAAPPPALEGNDLEALQIERQGYGMDLQTQGACDAVACSIESELLITSDGGQTWQPVTLPETQPRLQSDQAALPEIPGALSPEAAADLSRTLTMTGQAFDKCEIATLAAFQDWFTNSPYKVSNLYIGGISRSCGNSAMTGEYLAQVSAQGWRFIPTWVGYQASCSSYSNRIPTNTTEAYNLGVSEANAALDKAISLGLTAPDGTGTVIYYDLEAFDYNNTTCMNSAKSFINGWTKRMHDRGSLSGVYSRGFELTQLNSIANKIDVIWPANWYCNASPTCAYNPNATVWNVTGLSNTLWPTHQRIRQYAGGHEETWGTTLLKIDSNVIDGVVADTTDTYPLKVVKDGQGTGTVTSSPTSINCGPRCFANFDRQSSVTLSAAPADNAVFAGWSSNCTPGTGNSCTLSLDAATVVTATFAMKTYPLDVLKDGSGSGTVSSSPAGIDCGASCSATFEFGTLATLTATPTLQDLTGWSANCTPTGQYTCQIKIGTSNQVTATFGPAQKLTVTRSGNGSGKVTSSPSRLDCGTVCAQNFVEGATVTLSASSAPGAYFVGWSANCTPTGPLTCQVSLAQAQTVNAEFATNRVYVPWSGKD